MKKFFAPSLIVAAALVTPAFAQPTVDGSLSDGDYAAPVVGNNLTDSGYGTFGMTSIRSFRDATDLYIGVAGVVEQNGNNFRIIVGKAGTADGIQAGNALTGGADGLSPFSGFTAVLGSDADLGVRLSGSGDNGGSAYCSAINYRTGLAEAVGADEYVGNALIDGTPITEADGNFADGVTIAYQPGTWPADGTLGAEIRIPLAAIGAVAADDIEVFALMGGGGGGNISWSFIPGVTGYNTYDTSDFSALTPSQVVSVAGDTDVSDWQILD